MGLLMGRYSLICIESPNCVESPKCAESLKYDKSPKCAKSSKCDESPKWIARLSGWVTTLRMGHETLRMVAMCPSLIPL